ncbi:glycoside hydrolase family 95-like protein [Rhizobium laguerreae]
MPTAWPGGRIRGLRLRGGMLLDLDWEGGEPLTIRLTASRNVSSILRFGQTRRRVDLAAGESFFEGGSEFR